eukprot:gene388-1022_t
MKKLIEINIFPNTVEEDCHCKTLAKAAAKSLKCGKVIAVPTDTIYGVAALSQSNKAVELLYEIKGRHRDKPIAICVAEIEDIYRWCHVSVSKQILQDLLPGPVTLVFRRIASLNPDLNPTTNLIGVRIPDHLFIREIARECCEPIALTSANRSSELSSVKVTEFSHLWPKLDLVFDGGCLGNTEESRLGSTVVDLSVEGKYKIIRDGCALDMVENILRDKYFLQCAT